MNPLHGYLLLAALLFSIGLAVALTRQMLWRLAPEPSPYPTLKVDGALAMALGATADVREGVSAFLEKRPPAFPGKVSTDMPAGYPWWDR